MFKNPFSFNGRIRRLEYGLSSIIYGVASYVDNATSPIDDVDENGIIKE